ncbi:TetR family transcriptional regulator [Williamsia limnetica]|uniref:TetR family transcriptional regulator n=1 Tax=Williamsia limnetica TaxID=882452 RepID=A0A318RQH6_WILLI|nr:TetR/AcrR family transcriptional regulator [Williamsia limnetica]PYE17526.1 TetR family transcriptional regulator [Williamsia limnetica]
MRSRQKILDATLGLIGNGGFEAVNIAAVASAAGVSRQTVYSIFGSREDLVSQAIAGVALDVLSAIRSKMESIESPVEYIVELIVNGRAFVRDDRLLATLWTAGEGNPLFDTGMMTRARPIAHELLSPLAERNAAVKEDLDEIVEISLRLGLSVVLFDDEAIHSDDDLRAFLTRWLGPALPSHP